MSGFIFGFVNINSFATLLDVFGASLRSNNPRDDIMDPYDVRRHGGGMGVWLAFWAWCNIGSISLGFVVGAFIISNSSVDWGFWVTLIILMAVLMLNIVAPEVRRSAFRRTVKEIMGDHGEFSRIARGEVKLHLTGNGPCWWGEEVKAGLQLSLRMIKQPGFFVLALYSAWVYAQFTLVLMVGLCCLSLALGAALMLPFQKASWFSRARYSPPRTDSMTFQKAAIWESHTTRRTLFTTLLPIAAIGYSVASRGPMLPVGVPCCLAGLVAMASNLAIAESYSLTMQTFDTSDLQPGMTGRPARGSIAKLVEEQRTNFSCYPRVSAGVAVTQFLEFTFGAVSTAICGRVQRRYGATEAAAIAASVLMSLTILFALAVFRFKSVQMIPATHGGRRQGESA
ncbi:uncharacterized protein A1O9_07215 [Exophiala aquamarina CBS 119918]|uniref:Major facilitator superfamily (MFS) profile domain-containing protein n=1 Tax=Exophiala aquamarina CBS 119918 TaxID=1182545 RepID=A0A072PNA9_9EURO|nr:uncharacterized protein A1O9_07215 [Exophiala aquamarina CBS 119918]KEF57025.1 hypothetical protein A1O9_07215 [Exophiala aquamarina CBS 119918]